MDVKVMFTKLYATKQNLLILLLAKSGFKIRGTRKFFVIQAN